MKKSKWVLLSSLFFIFGIAFSGCVEISFFIIYSLLVFTIFLATMPWGNSRSKIFFTLLIFLLIGMIRYEMSRPEDFSIEKSKKTLFTGMISEEPIVRGDYQNIIIKNKDVKVLSRVNVHPSYFYGQVVEINCSPKTPDHKTTYGRYLLKDKIRFICYYPGVKIISNDNGNKFYTYLLQIKQKSRDIIERGLPDPEAQILSAMLLGYKNNISKELRDSFSKVGISHVVAISGMHLAIISIILIHLLIVFGAWRKQAFYVTIVLLWIFILMIGAPASAMRAGVMISVVLWANYLGRISSVVGVLFFTASVLLLFNPLLLFGDIGFQLSFLAVLGILYLNGVLSSLFKKIPEFYGIKKILIVTLSAQIATLPLSVYYFGNMPILSLPINLLVIPLLPIILSIGIIIVFTGFVFENISIFISWIVWPFLKVLLIIVDLFLLLPISYLYIEGVNFIFIFVFYIFLFYIIFRLQKINRYNDIF